MEDSHLEAGVLKEASTRTWIDLVGIRDHSDRRPSIAHRDGLIGFLVSCPGLSSEPRWSKGRLERDDVGGGVVEFLQEANVSAMVTNPSTRRICTDVMFS